MDPDFCTFPAQVALIFVGPVEKAARISPLHNDIDKTTDYFLCAFPALARRFVSPC